MFCEGEYVMYSGEGLCRIEKIGIPDFQSEKRNYYFLQKADDHSRIYVPTDTTLPMRKPLTAAEANQFLESLSMVRIDIPRKLDNKKWLPVIKDTVRPQTAEAMVKTIRMIRLLHPDGKIPAEEKTILTRTEKRLFDEIAFALHVSETDAESRVKSALKTLTIQESLQSNDEEKEP